MIIDSHAHLAMPPGLYQYMGELVASRASPAAPFNGLPREAIESVTAKLIDVMNGVGTDMQFLSPRPYMMMHSVRPSLVGMLWTRAVTMSSMPSASSIRSACAASRDSHSTARTVPRSALRT